MTPLGDIDIVTAALNEADTAIRATPLGDGRLAVYAPAKLTPETLLRAVNTARAAEELEPITLDQLITAMKCHDSNDDVLARWGYLW